MKARWLAGAAAALALLAACQRLSNVRRCRALASDVNDRLDRIEEQTKQRTPAGYASASRAYTELAQSLAIPVVDAGADAAVAPLDAGELDHALTDYRATITSAAHATAELAEALDAGNQASAAVFVRELESLSQRAKVNAKRIDASCRPD